MPLPLLYELQYHPPLQVFADILQADELLLEAQEHYQKQTYRNRCHILTANGVLPLVVPVLHTQPKILAQEVEIDYSQRWAAIHWRTIRSAYASAPYFPYYADAFEAVYESRPKYLFELNLALLQLHLKYLGWKGKINLTENYRTSYPTSAVDRRNLVHPKRKADNLYFPPYVQVFGSNFVPNLSILDLLFTQGPEAASYLAAFQTSEGEH